MKTLKERALDIVMIYLFYPQIRMCTTTSDPPESESVDNSDGIMISPDYNIYISKRLNRLLYAVDVVFFVLSLVIVIVLLPVYIPLKIYFIIKNGGNSPDAV